MSLSKSEPLPGYAVFAPRKKNYGSFPEAISKVSLASGVSGNKDSECRDARNVDLQVYKNSAMPKQKSPETDSNRRPKHEGFRSTRLL